MIALFRPTSVGLRIAVVGVATALVAGVYRVETLLVQVLLVAAVARVVLTRFEAEERRKRLYSLAGTVALGLLGGLARHLVQARQAVGDADAMRMLSMLRPAEVLWTGWLYVGCVAAVEGLDHGIRQSVRWLPSRLAANLTRVVLIVLLLPGPVAAVYEMHWPKLDSRLPKEAREMEPTRVETRTADGVAIRGWYFDRGETATVVVVPGIGDHSAITARYLLPLLRNRPVNGLLVDLRGQGFSGGHTASFGRHGAADVAAALAWVDRRDPVASERVVFYGFSLGSAAAVAAADRREGTAGVIVDSGFDRLPGVAWAMAEALPPVLRRSAYYTGLSFASAMSQTWLWSVEPGETVSRLDTPVLVLHGGADGVIPPEQGKKLLARENVRGRIVQGGRHTRLPAADSSYFLRIGQFLDEVLGDGTDNRDPARLEAVDRLMRPPLSPRPRPAASSPSSPPRPLPASPSRPTSATPP